MFTQVNPLNKSESQHNGFVEEERRKKSEKGQWVVHHIIHTTSMHVYTAEMNLFYPEMIHSAYIRSARTNRSNAYLSCQHIPSMYAFDLFSV